MSSLFFCSGSVLPIETVGHPRRLRAKSLIFLQTCCLLIHLLVKSQLFCFIKVFARKIVKKFNSKVTNRKYVCRNIRLQSIKCTRYIHQNEESYAYWCQQRMSRWGNRIEQKTLICANLATILSLPRSFFVSRKSQRRRGSAFVVSLFCCLDLSAVVT